jgi:serine/threonine protein kinase
MSIYGRLDVWYVQLSFPTCAATPICVQTFELLTGAPLFDPHDDPAGRFTVDDQHLLHMIQLKGQPFPAEMLKRSGKASAFFEPNGDMLRVRIADIHANSQLRSVGTLIRFQGEISPRSILQSIRNYKTVDDLTELEAAAGFLERCLAFLPEQRASAIDLLDDPWLQAWLFLFS